MKDRFRQMRARDQAERIEKTIEMMGSIGKVVDASDSIVNPNVFEMVDLGDKFMRIGSYQYPNCKKLDIVFYKNEYPFDAYYSRAYYEREIPKKYRAKFDKLSQILDEGLDNDGE